MSEEEGDERIRRLEAELTKLRKEAAHGRRQAAPSPTTPSISLPSANPCALPRSLLTARYPHLLQVRGDLELYSHWKSGTSRYVQFMSGKRKGPTK